MLRLSVLGLCLLLGCTSTAPAPGAPEEVECEAFDMLVTLADYSSSFCGALGPERASVHASFEFGTDPVLRLTGGRAFLLNRLPDGTAFELSPRCGTVRGSKLILSPPQAGDNPQDLALAPNGELWVPFFNEPVLRVFPAGASIDDAGVSELSLAAFDDDGNPNAASALYLERENAIVVSIGLLDDTVLDLPPKAPGKLLGFDADSRALRFEHTLEGVNPFGLLMPVGELVYVSEIGSHRDGAETTAGLEVFDPANRRSQIWLDERTLGGSVAQIAVAAEAGCGAALVFGGGALNPTSLVTFTAPTTAAELASMTPRVLAREVLATPGFELSGLAWQGDTLYVGDRRRVGAGYLVHKLIRDASCTLTRAGEVSVPQMPLGLAATPPL